MLTCTTTKFVGLDTIDLSIHGSYKVCERPGYEPSLRVDVKSEVPVGMDDGFSVGWATEGIEGYVSTFDSDDMKWEVGGVKKSVSEFLK